jgi:hypothetical protein
MGVLATIMQSFLSGLSLSRFFLQPSLFRTRASFRRFRLPRRLVRTRRCAGHALDHFVAAARDFLVSATKPPKPKELHPCDHFQKLPFHNPLPAGKRPPASYALYPSWADFRHRDIGGIPNYCYTIIELNYYTSEFQKLRQEVIHILPRIAQNHHRHQSSPQKFRAKSDKRTNQKPVRIGLQ